MPLIALDSRDALDPTLRGWGRYAFRLVRELREGTAAEGLDMIFLDGDSPGPEIVWEQVSLPRRLRDLAADVIHSPNCFLPLRRPCPGVVTIHDLAFEEHRDDFTRRTGWKYRTFVPRAVRSAELVICPSAFTARDVTARYGVDDAKLRVIPEAPALPRGDAEPPGGFYLLAVGDLRAKKNLLRLIDAFKLLVAEELPHRLVLAGVDAGEGKRLREAALGLPVEFTGYVSDGRLDALMRGADLVVHPSLYEGFGLVLVEAMARGIPVAAADTGALPETAGGAAVLFDPLEPEDIARGIREALRDAPRLAEAGRARAAGLSWDRTARMTVDAYREVLP